MMRAVVSVGFALAQLLAAEAPASRPALGISVMGYVRDSSGGLRALLGIPGAALQTGVIDPGLQISAMAAAPDAAFLLASPAGDGRPVLLVPNGGEFAARPIHGAGAAIDRLFLSPAGSAAVLFSSARNTIEIVTGLPDDPVISRRIDAAALPFSPRTLAVSDDGRLVLAAAAPDEGAAPVLLGPQDGCAELPVPAPSAMAFRTGTHDALLASAGGGLWVARGMEAQPDYERIAGAPDAGRAVAVGFASDGRRFYAAWESGTIARIDPGTGAAQAVSCGCSPAALERLRGDDVFRLNGGDGAPLLVLDGGGPEPRVLFIPPDGGDQ